MADKVVTSKTCTWTLELTRGNNVASRTITFDIVDDSLAPDIKAAMISNFIPSLVGGGLSTVIQPTGWRDNDVSEQEYHCTGIGAKVTSKTDMILDLG